MVFAQERLDSGKGLVNADFAITVAAARGCRL